MGAAGKDLSRDLTAARISVYEAGLDVANPDLDPYDNFVAFQQRVAAGYDAMVSVRTTVHARSRASSKCAN